MGVSFSAFNKLGLPGLTSAATKHVYEKHFKNKNTDNFEDFHVAYVELCKFVNTVMPGQDFKTPSNQQIKDFYDNVWSKKKDDATKEEELKEEFLKFMEENVREEKTEDKVFIMTVTGLAAPAVAVIGKRASQHIPYVKNMRLDLVPNVLFVPLFTLGAIVAATAAQISGKSTQEEKKQAEAAAEQEKGEPNKKK